MTALNKLRGHRNTIAHSWDQDSVRDFEAEPIPLMDDLEGAMIHMDIKDGGDGD